MGRPGGLLHFGTWLVLLALGGALHAQPSYTRDSVVNGATFTPGPLALNAIGTIFGKGLSFFDAAAAPAGTLPTELGFVRVLVNNNRAPLLYVSSRQINFLVPPSLRPGEVNVQVDRQGLYGPSVQVTLAAAAPALFCDDNKYLLAQHGLGNRLVDIDNPAAPGEIVVLYGTGFGAIDPPLISNTEVPAFAARVVAAAQVQVGGAPAQVLYCGVTPGFGGLYQINLRLPDDLPVDPEVTVTIGGKTSPAGAKLARPISQQPSMVAPR
jgi:uncharacterized protein (TIGR03437 family)